MLAAPKIEDYHMPISHRKLCRTAVAGLEVHPASMLVYTRLIFDYRG